MEDNKSGKRVRGKIVEKLEEAIQQLSVVLSWSKYEESDDKARVVPFKPKPKVQAPATRSTPNWSAKVGETIIGNLVRGAGGKFASKRSLMNMMELLESAGISPDMFKALQELMAGNQYTDELILGQLEEAGLISKDGVPTGKANDIMRSIKTGDEKELEKILDPKAGGGGGGGGGGGKPSKEEVEAENIDKTGETLVQRGVMTEEEFAAFKAFVNGEEIDPAMEAKLKEMGLIDEKGALSAAGKDLSGALSDGDVRAALDAIATAKNEDTVTEGIENSTEKLVASGALSKSEADAFKKFAEGDKISNAAADALVEKGLLGKIGDTYYLTGSNQREGGRGVWTALQQGQDREAIDAVTKSQAAMESAQEGDSTLPEAVRQNNITSASNTILEQKVMTQDEIGGLLNFTAGGNVNDETLQALLERGLLTKTPRGNYVRSEAGKRFLQALEGGNGESAILALENKSFGSKVFKGRDGKTWLMTWTMNAFKDRELETFTTKSIEDYIKRFEDAAEKGEVDFWHIPGTDYATIKWQGGVGRFLVEMSLFDDTKMGKIFEKFFTMYPDGHPIIAPDGWGCSHGYKYRSFDRKSGVYNWFEKKKTTVLALGAAANVFTLAKFGFGEKEMELSKKQAQALQVIGEEVGETNLVAMVEQAGQAYTKALEDGGISYKSRAEGSAMKLKEFGRKLEEVVGMVEDAEMKAEMEEMGEEVMSEPEAVMRRLMELTAQIGQEELRVEMEALISFLAPEVEEPIEEEVIEAPIEEELADETVMEEAPMEEVPAEEPVAEEPVEEELVEEEPVEDEEDEEDKEDDEEDELVINSTGGQSLKERDVQFIAEALHLSELQQVIENQGIKMAQIEESFVASMALSKDLLETIKELKSELGGLKEQTNQIEKDDETKIAEKKLRFVPVWGGVQASRAASTVLNNDADKQLSRPKVPSTISSMSRHISGGK